MLFSCTSNTVEITLGVSKELAEYRFSNYSNIHYELHFELPEEKEADIFATSLIKVTLKDNTKPLILDFKANDTHIDNLIVNNETCSYDYIQEHIVIPNTYLVEGENKISFQFKAGKQSLNRNKDYMYTLLVPDRARTLFPCFDQPDLKAKYVLSLDMPEKWEAIAGEYATQKETVEGRKLLVFGETAPISTYLFSFVAGNFKKEEYDDGKHKFTMLHLVDKEKIDKNKDAIFKLHVKAIDWIENYTNIPLPFHKLDFALLPPFQYGGMEHVGAIQYRSSSLILDENAGDTEKLRRAQLISHEVAHMWFGDLVTMKWFDDVWLKEVFANFIAAKAVEPSYPEINHDVQFYVSHQYRAYPIDRTEGTHPIQQNLENLNLAGTLYGAIIYSKAPVVMAQLEEIIGSEALQLSLQNYLKKYAFSNATFDDLINVIVETTAKDIKPWADQWVKKAGMPKYKLSIEEDNLVIKTEDIGWSQIIKVNNTTVNINSANTSAPLGKAGNYPLDQSAKGYGYFELAADLQTLLIKNIANYSDKEAMTVYGNLWENFLHKNIAIETYLPFILERLKVEDNSLLKKMLFGQFKEIYWYYLSKSERTKLTKKEFPIFKNLLEKSTTNTLKTFYLKVLISLDHTKEEYAFLEQYITQKNTIPTISDANRIALFMKLRMEKLATSREMERTVANNLSSDYYRSYLTYITPSTSPDYIERDAFFEDIKNVKNRGNEPWVENGLGYLNHPLQAANSIKYIEATLNLLPEIQKTGDIFFPFGYLKNSIGKRTEKSVIKKVHQFLEHNNIDDKLEAKILQNLDPVIRRNQFTEML
ncbi:M1 family metallopeptidase [Flammeovirga kamogawensis]|uniref:Aminopeptidase N n=1 Tax=Flammeovirga kamogawensis TaxID=373891 RepID=A0ABX8H3S1_9BACT|nr:M1 family aminopeptidase [Flammeovirga kamogawensis]MBB6463574.1 aminopeptidase N [Flammeovirga kamogawensis]QWG09800.1 hypothetical protein KM029_19155 [Flammeovirga kamogawensis]